MQAVRNIEPNGHVVIVTGPFFGHMIPLLDFAKHLSIHHHVTYVVSISKLDELEQRGLISSNMNSSNNSNSTTSQLEFVGLLDNSVDANEIFDSTPTSKLDRLIDRMREPLTQLLSLMPVASSLSSYSSANLPLSPLLSTRSITRPVHLIISDLFIPLPIQIAHQRHVPAQIFFDMSFETIFWFINISTGDEVNLRMSRQFAQNFLEVFPLADGLICNSIAQLEKHALDRFREQSVIASNLPVRFVGPLFSEKDELSKSQTIVRVQQWLDNQWYKANGSSSVIYISFGSIVDLTAEQIVEISRTVAPYPYIWSLKSNLHKHLPLLSGDDEMHLVIDWTPQRLILFHPAVHFFVSHGGWNSVCESMLGGKPMLVWPMFGDQFLNAHRIEQEFRMGRVIQNTHSKGHARLVSADELVEHVQHMFDLKMYVKEARQVQMIAQHARDYTSREHLDEITNIVNNEMVRHNPDIQGNDQNGV